MLQDLKAVGNTTVLADYVSWQAGWLVGLVASRLAVVVLAGCRAGAGRLSICFALPRFFGLGAVQCAIVSQTLVANNSQVVSRPGAISIWGRRIIYTEHLAPTSPTLLLLLGGRVYSLLFL